jgi:hypothetical protein
MEVEVSDRGCGWNGRRYSERERERERKAGVYLWLS